MDSKTIYDILDEVRNISLTEKEKGTSFERLMKLWFMTDPRYSHLDKVWLWEEFPAKKDFGDEETTGIVNVGENSSLFTLHLQSGIPSTDDSYRENPHRRVSISQKDEKYS